MSTIKDFEGYSPTWCPGCGDWGIGISIKQALSGLNLEPASVGVVFDIGCSGNMNDFLNAYAIHGLHGRSIPTAIGMKIANPKMSVMVIGGDGGLYGEGGNHFLHACRGNHDITVLVHDNSVYGLTTGQVAPTAFKGTKSKSTPTGMIDIAINPLSFAISSGATFVANAFAGDVKQLIELIKAGIQHKGFSVINVLQPCVTFNKVNTYQYYLQRTYKLAEDYQKNSYELALAKSLELIQEKYPLGILYQVERSAYHEQLSQIPQGSSLLEKDVFEEFGPLLKGFI